MINVIIFRIFLIFEGLLFFDFFRLGLEYIFVFYFFFLLVVIDSEFYVVYDSKFGDI